MFSRSPTSSSSRAFAFSRLSLDGVNVETEAKDGTRCFEAALAPSREELQETLQYVYARVMKWLARRGLFREADASNEAPSYSAGEAMTLAGMQRGTLETAKDTGERAEHELAEPPPRVTDAAVHERFNLHASVHVPAHDDLARERLCRYLARPAFSLARLGVRRDGLVVSRVKNAGDGSASALPPSSAARGACGAPHMASARGAAPARIAGRMHHVVIHDEEHELGGSGDLARRGISRSLVARLRGTRTGTCRSRPSAASGRTRQPTRSDSCRESRSDCRRARLGRSRS